MIRGAKLPELFWKTVGPLLGRHRLFQAMSLYPPFLGAGIRIVEVAPDRRRFVVELRMSPINRNWVGTHFGGSLYAMCDPFFMLILMENLGTGYVVWDKAAQVRFVRPGRGTVRACFEIAAERIEQIRAAADRDGKTEASFTAEVHDATGEVVARVEKLIYVRNKAAYASDKRRDRKSTIRSQAFPSP